MRKFAAVVTVVCVLSSLGMLSAQQGSKNEMAQTVQPRLAKIYAVKDLAVWSENGDKFDPSILIALLKSKVTPGQWNGKNSINPLVEKALLVVNTTQDAHEAIAETLAELRKQ